MVHAGDDDFPGFYRVVWNSHAAEFSDLSAPDRSACMEAVVVVERCLREHLKPAKVNLAALGNVVAHLHWHVIARFDWDSRFPDPVWAPASRQVPAHRLSGLRKKLPVLERDIVRLLGL